MVLPLDTILIVMLLAVQAGLLLYTLVRRRMLSQRRWQYISTLVLAAVVVALHALPSEWQLTPAVTRDALIWVALSATIGFGGGIILSDMLQAQSQKRLLQFWIGFVVAWLVSFGAALLLIAEPFAGWTSWAQGALHPAVWVSLIALAIAASVLFGLGFYHFYKVPMPEAANRYAFWIVTITLYLIAGLLIASGSAPIMLVGDVLLITALAMKAYALENYRLLDVRRVLVNTIRLLTAVSLIWGLAFGLLYLANQGDFADLMGIDDEMVNTLAISGLALLLAFTTIPIYQFVNVVFKQFTQRSTMSLAAASAHYSQRMARASTLEEVVTATVETLNDVMGVKRSALILINNTFRVPDAVELIVLEGGATIEAPTHSGYLSKYSPIYHSLALEKVPLGQYDIEYGPTFQRIPDEERIFFRGLSMSTYVPIVADNRLLGVLSTGPKLNDMPFYREDMELLSVIGQQVGTVLRSARLIDDLQHLNDSMRVLNKRLENAKVELEKLDSIKTDFITIASHELRTPLAQIRGYTDIIDSLSQSGMLNPDQTGPMVNNLRRSTERMEELISAMLDVSQIDVNSMDLRFIRTTPDTIVRMALEPLRDPAEQRHLNITTEDLKSLPHVQADLQRMVQAFRNLILNAIKFTPDGGDITISAEFEEKAGDEIDNVLFRIKDTGVGVAPKDVKYIFQKFYRGFDTQLHSTGIYKFMGAGPGLGLTIAKGIIEGHGGEIWVESPGHDMKALPGSTFYVRLPLHPPEGVRRVLPFEEEKKVRSTANMKKVEVVDAGTQDAVTSGSAQPTTDDAATPASDAASKIPTANT